MYVNFTTQLNLVGNRKWTTNTNIGPIYIPDSGLTLKNLWLIPWIYLFIFFIYSQIRRQQDNGQWDTIYFAIMGLHKIGINKNITELEIFRVVVWMTTGYIEKQIYLALQRSFFTCRNSGWLLTNLRYCLH